MKLKLVRSVVLIFALGLSVAARASELTLVGDAHVSSIAGRSTVNFGTQSNLYVGSGNTAFLQFDTSSTLSLPAGISASQIARATLTVFVNRIYTAGSVSVSPVTSGWNEGTVTYDAQPTVGATIQSVTPTQAGQFITFDVTSMVQSWVSGTTNNGLAITSAAGYMLLDSKENDQTGHAARLDVTVTSVGPQGIKGDTGAQGTKGDAGQQGSPGTAGVPGAGYYATSTTSNQTVGTGTKTFATQAGLAYVAGARVRAINTNATSNYVEGTVTSYSGTALTLMADSSVGSGTPTSWAFSVAGVQGQQGIQGTQGSQGNTGPQGAKGDTGATGGQGQMGLTGPTTWTASLYLPADLTNARGIFGPPLGVANAQLITNTGSSTGFIPYWQGSVEFPQTCTISNLSVTQFGLTANATSIQQMPVEISYATASQLAVGSVYLSGVTCTLKRSDGSGAGCVDATHKFQVPAGNFVSIIAGTVDGNAPTSVLITDFEKASLLITFTCTP